MTTEFFSWCPFIALMFGALATLGFYRSRGWGIGLVSGVLLLQVAVWTLVLLGADVWQNGWTAEWNTVFVAAFRRSLTGVVPYTVIGAVFGGFLVVLSRLSVRQEVEEAREDAAGGKPISQASIRHR